MSVFSGRRTSSATSDRTRSDAAAPASANSRVPAPHFKPAPSAPVDAESLDEARRVADDLRILLAGLEEREQNLNSQLTLLEQGQRALRLQTQQFETDTAERQAALEILSKHVAERETEVERLTAARQRVLDAQQAELDRERDSFRAELLAAVADDRRQIESERAELQRGRSELAEQLARQLDELDRATAELAAECAARRKALDEQQADIESRQTTLRVELLAEITEHRQQIETDRAELELSRAELAEEVAIRQAEREQEIADHTALLVQLREEQLADVEIREAEVTQREVDLIKRTKFQEEHLSRLRSAIEARQADLERERAAKSVWSADVDASVRSRLSHLRKFRDLLESRELACDAAWQSLGEAQAQQQSMLVDLRLYVSDEQQALAAQQSAVAGDLRRHAELMALREQELERRSVRTERFREELARRHYELAAREASLQDAKEWLSDQLGAEAVAMLLHREEAEAPPASDVSQHQREIADAERQLAEWQHQLQREREAFSQQIIDREQRLQERENSLAWQWEQLTAREAALQTAQARDRSDREQAFAVLESLVGQLERKLTSATKESSTD